MCVFGIYTNLQKDVELVATRKIIDILESRSATYFLDGSLAEAMGSDRTCPDEELSVVLVLGGDGTMLTAARRFAPYGTLLMGINMGRLGFLLDAEMEEMEAAIDGILAGRFQVEERMLLSASILGPEGKFVKGSALAMNDAVVYPKDAMRLIHVEICVSGLPVTTLCCSGVIVSTPTGSTGYSLSAGGPVVLPTLDVMLITPICAHSLQSSVFVISGEDTVSIRPVADSQPTVLTLDGQAATAIEEGEWVRIQKADVKAKFIRFTDKSFFDRLKEKLSEWNN